MEKNLNSGEAIKKLQSLINDIKTCILITSGKNGTRTSRPMAVINTDHMGNVWFFTGKDSNKVRDIEIEHFVQLIFAHPGKDSYLDVRGRANVVTDKTTIKENWTPIVKAWFPDGIDDPNLCLLQIKTDEAHYWDTDTTKMVQIAKTALSIVTGKPLVEGVHGDLNI